MKPFIIKLRTWAKILKCELLVLYGVSRDARTPWLAKVVAWMVLAYALSPIDLIPDFIPILGYLDDLILVPAGILLAIRLIPSEILAEHRARLIQETRLPNNWIAAVIIVTLWLLMLLLAIRHFG